MFPESSGRVPNILGNLGARVFAFRRAPRRAPPHNDVVSIRGGACTGPMGGLCLPDKLYYFFLERDREPSLCASLGEFFLASHVRRVWYGEHWRRF